MCKNSKNSAEKSNFASEMCKQQPKKTVTGVYGGSFNPIHRGHTCMASEIVRQGLVDEVWLVVSPQNPLKDSGLWDDEFRLSLAGLAVEGMSGVEVSDVEFGLPKPNYMVTTLATLSDRFPDREFVLIIGMDNWECFHLWYNWEHILRTYRVIVLPRQSEAPESAADTVLPGAQVTFARLPLINISSTWIRSQISNNPSYDGEGLDTAVWHKIKNKSK